jgi:hypothetical protein
MKTSARFSRKQTGESIPSVNRTARKLRLRVPSALRAPAAGYLKR